MVSPFKKMCVFLNPSFDMVNGIWADFYHLMLDNVSDLDTRSGTHVPKMPVKPRVHCETR